MSKQEIISSKDMEVLEKIIEQIVTARYGKLEYNADPSLYKSLLVRSLEGIRAKHKRIKKQNYKHKRKEDDNE